MKQRLTLYITPEAADRLNLVANYRKGARWSRRRWGVT
jgi:hypothetical protein